MLPLAVALAVALSTPAKHKRHAARSNLSAAKTRSARSTLELALRHELLHDFLVETGSEQPAFFDARTVDAGGGLRVGPTSVSVDFLGAPIVRARVFNASDREIDALVIATVRDARGGTARAS